MDLIQICAKSFQELLAYDYHFIIGRKGKLKEFYLNFDKADFHHMLGLHKLKDIAQIQHGMREKIFDKIVSGEITEELIKKSAYYDGMKMRIIPLTGLQDMLDENNIIFRYNEKVQKFSMIKADYLLEGNAKDIQSFLFLGRRNDDECEQMCRTFFPKCDIDYTQGQPQYTLLKKEKRNIVTGEVIVQYDKLSSK